MKFSLLSAVLVPIFAGCFAAQGPKGDERLTQAWDAVQGWSTDARQTGEKFIDQYGPPDHLGAGSMAWFHNGGWKRIEVFDRPSPGDVIEETVAYRVPPEKRAALASFSDKLRVSQDGRDLSVRGASEAENFLTINLAAEIIKSYTTPAEARRSFTQTMNLRASGKNSAFTEGLRFLSEP